MPRAIVIAALVAAGCGTGDRIDECDRLVAVVEKVAVCPKLDRLQRTQIAQAVKSIREALDKLADVGIDKAPAVTVTATRQSCVKQREELEASYQKVAAECLR